MTELADRARYVALYARREKRVAAAAQLGYNRNMSTEHPSLVKVIRPLPATIIDSEGVPFGETVLEPGRVYQVDNIDPADPTVGIFGGTVTLIGDGGGYELDGGPELFGYHDVDPDTGVQTFEPGPLEAVDSPTEDLP